MTGLCGIEWEGAWPLPAPPPASLLSASLFTSESESMCSA